MRMKKMKCDENRSNMLNIDVNISDIVFTPFACASIINEVLKGVLYQKCQIPYPYNWMKNIITKKRQNNAEATTAIKQNFRAESHFRLVSNVLDTVEAAMSSITNEFVDHKNNVKKVVIVLGTTPHTAKEVFTISVSSIIEGHSERNHISQLNKYQQKILRSIFLSQDWLDKIDASISCTNIFIYIIKKNSFEDKSLSESSVFLPSEALNFPKNTKHIKISLNSDMQLNTNCCDSLMVFEEDSKENGEVLDNIPSKEQLIENLEGDSKENGEVLDNTPSKEEPIENLRWYKYKDLVKGFKDCFINKKSVSELW